MANKQNIQSVIDAQKANEGIQSVISKLRELVDVMGEVKAATDNYKNASGTVDLRKSTEDLDQTTKKLVTTNQVLLNGIKQVSETGTTLVKTHQATTQAVSEAGAAIDKHSTKIKGLSENAKILQQALANVKAQLDAATKAGSLNSTQVEKLAQQNEVLTALLNQQQRGFASLTMEIRAGERALQTMRESGLANTTEFKKMQVSVADSRQSFNEFAKTQKILSSEAPGITALATAARGLAGAYGVAAGASALFSSEDEKVQKELNRLIALLTIMRGLEEAVTLLKQRSAIVTALQTTALKAWNATATIRNFILTGSFASTKKHAEVLEQESVALLEDTGALETNTGAELENLATKEESVVAGEAEVAITEEQTVAQQASTATIESATVATSLLTGAVNVLKVAFRGLLIASGIGLVIMAVGYLIEKIMNLVGAQEKLKKNSEEMVKSLEGVHEAMMAQAEAINLKYKDQLSSLKAQLEHAEKQNVSYEKKHAILTKINELEKQISIEKVTQLGISQDQIDQNNATYEQDAKALEDLNKQKYAKEESAKSMGKEYKDKELDDEIDHAKSQMDLAKKVADGKQKLLDDLSDKTKEGDLLNEDLAKFNAEERRKIILETTQIEANLVIEKNNKILSNERSTQDQRLNAIQRIGEEQKKIVKAQLNDILSDPSKTNADRLIAQKQYSTEITKINADTLRAFQDATDSYRIRELSAWKTIHDYELQETSDTNKKLSDNVDLSLNERLQYYKRYTEAQKKLIEDNYHFQLQQAGLSGDQIGKFQKDSNYHPENIKATYEELLGFRAAYQNSLLKMSSDTVKGVAEIHKSEVDQGKVMRDEDLANVQSSFARIQQSQDDQYQQDLESLNDQLHKKKISLNDYNDERKKLDKQYQKSVQENLINELNAQISAYTGAEANLSAAQLHLGQLQDQYSQTKTEGDQANILQQIVLSKQEVKLAEETVSKKTNLVKQYNAARAALAKQEGDIASAEQQKWIKDFNEITSDTEKLAQEVKSLGDNIYQRQINQINAKKTALDDAYSHEMDLINNSSLTYQQRIQQTAALENRHAAQKKQLDDEEKSRHIAKAKFDKAESIFKIIIDTAKAIVGDLGDPWKIAFDASMGALQLAVAASAPMPAYAVGSKDTAGGLAIVGERGTELVQTPGGEMFLTPGSASVMNLPKHSKVWTADETKNLTESLFYNDLRTVSFSDKTVRELRAQTEMMKWQTREYVKAIKTITKNPPKVIINNSSKHEEWVRRNVRE